MSTFIGVVVSVNRYLFTLSFRGENVHFTILKQINMKADKYRVGKSQHRAILEVETGKEYLIFPLGSEQACVDYCKYLNSISSESEALDKVLNSECKHKVIFKDGYCEDCGELIERALTISTKTVDKEVKEFKVSIDDFIFDIVFSARAGFDGKMQYTIDEIVERYSKRFPSPLSVKEPSKEVGERWCKCESPTGRSVTPDFEYQICDTCGNKRK